jgi:hypothetical protein
MKKLQKSTTHYTNFGVKYSPSVADNCGFIHYREGFETLDPQRWTEAEQWLYDQTERINEWRAAQQ